MIDTDRLILRPWRQEDVTPFHAMGQDAEVMRYIGPLLTLDGAQAVHDRMTAFQAADGYCFWAVERRGDARFIGFCGLKPGKYTWPDEPEIGWRLARDVWGQGYAREAATASLAWAWTNLDAPTIAAITVPANTRSWGLMERLGMTRDPVGDFDHPDLAPGDPLRRHLTYRIARPA